MINILQHINRRQLFKSILCLDGDLPQKAFFQHYALPVIAADGAANKLMALGIKPQIVIGDLDSIHPDLLAAVDTLHKPDQNSCDYEKSLVYLRAQNLLPCIVCGMNGGALDHILNNINIFMQADNLLYTEQMLGQVLPAGEIYEYTLPINTKISSIGLPHAIVSSKGLQWELTDHVMAFPGANSCFNRVVTERVTIEVKKGLLLVLIYSNKVDTDQEYA